MTTDRKLHNEYCTAEWDLYRGAGPRGMGPNGDGCYCSLAPLTVEEETVEDHSRDVPPPAKEAKPFEPRLWDKRPDSVTHVVAPAMHIFGIYLRQRCAWCGEIILEYDLRRVMVPVGQEGPPAVWEPFSMVRVDAHMTALVEEVIEDGNIKLPMDSCTFDPKTQIGA